MSAEKAQINALEPFGAVRKDRLSPDPVVPFRRGAEGMRLSAQNGTRKAGMPLATLLAQPAEVDNLDPRTLPDVLDRCSDEHHRVALLERRVHARLRSLQADQPAEDRLLEIDEAVAQLGVTKDWLRRRPTLPFVVKLSPGVVRYSAAGIMGFIAEQCRH